MKYNYPHFIYEVVKAQRGGVTNLSSDLSKWETWDSTHVCLTLILDPTLLTHPVCAGGRGPGVCVCLLSHWLTKMHYRKLPGVLQVPKTWLE